MPVLPRNAVLLKTARARDANPHAANEYTATFPAAACLIPEKGGAPKQRDFPLFASLAVGPGFLRPFWGGTEEEDANSKSVFCVCFCFANQQEFVARRVELLNGT